MVYVINSNGQPLMPTERYGKVKHLLKSGKAKIIRRCPFTIQLLYNTTYYTQKITLGINAGSIKIGYSATTETKELFASEVTQRTDIVKLIASRRELRAHRRSRKTRYRKPRFKNRKKIKGWLPPSIEERLNVHITVAQKINKILPITKCIIEVAPFDIQRIQNPSIKGDEYQQGPQSGFKNVKAYVKWRDNYTCQNCKGKSGSKKLHIHHRETRKTAGNRPEMLFTVCDICHIGHHNGTIQFPKHLLTKPRPMRDMAFMATISKELPNRLSTIFNNIEITFGYVTSEMRHKNKLSKTHCIDARCISDNPQAKPLDYIYYIKKVRCHNRQTHKAKFRKGHNRQRNQASYEVKNFRLFDTVEYQNKLYFIFARRQSGYFDIRDLQGNKVNKGSINYKKLKFIQPNSNYLIEQRRTTIS